jgi:DNA polymerase (family 10)
MYDAGGWVLLESAIADLPSDLRWLFESGAVTIEQLAVLHQQLGITAAVDLRAALASGSLREIAALGPAVEDRVRAAMPTLRASLAPIPLGRALSAADPVLSTLSGSPGVAFAEPVGSIRRGQDLVADVEIVAPAEDPSAPFARVQAMPEIVRCLHRSERRLYVLIDRVQIGVRSPSPDTAGGVMLYTTGSAAHIDALAAAAAARGWQLGPHGLTRPGADRPIAAATEAAIYAALDLPFIPPEIREGGEELTHARQGSLPALVSRGDIRGDLHMHTQYSDGRDTVEDMVQACVALGYHYMAITDHSPHSSAARNLSEETAARQAEEIAALRGRYPQIAILHGCEVDILPDGRLDFSDRMLERFDIVLASLHDDAGQSPRQLLARYVAAMRHPLVSIVTHPTNRLLPHRPGYDIDYDRLFETAVETRTVVEIDGAPAHLDLDGALARRAVRAGAMVSIDSDCHRAEMLDRQMRMGIATARRGWVEPASVLNTRSVQQVRAIIAAKRQG